MRAKIQLYVLRLSTVQVYYFQAVVCQLQCLVQFIDVKNVFFTFFIQCTFFYVFNVFTLPTFLFLKTFIENTI